MLNLSRGLMRHKPVPTTQSRTISIIIRHSSLCHILDQRSLSTVISDPPWKTRTRVSPGCKAEFTFGKNIEIFQTERITCSSRLDHPQRAGSKLVWNRFEYYFTHVFRLNVVLSHFRRS
ncbi:hypothetical protein ALC53_05991 [Atta colombica]|uniref:Uncharacterized protein n=1 Tax=Atta colombica TaxID=520822 RepID=A0A195BHE6_9HYME|nr:hypothetical protein ALC53_05991 [Atta colombica]